jgi:hypothetical protein
LVDHKLIFCQVDSPDEAVYLAAMINSTPMQDLLASYANEIAVSPQTLARLPIPDYEPASHSPIVEGGLRAFEVVRADEKADQVTLDQAVVDALRLSDYVPQANPSVGNDSADHQAAFNLED